MRAGDRTQAEYFRMQRNNDVGKVDSGEKGYIRLFVLQDVLSQACSCDLWKRTQEQLRVRSGVLHWF